MKRFLGLFVALFGLAALLSADVAFGDGGAKTLQDSGRRVITRTAGLTGAAEVPDPGDVDGFGIAHATFDRRTKVICVDFHITKIDVIVGAHIHAGDATTAGPIVVNLGVPDANGSSCAIVASRATFGAIWVNAADYYINVHTELFPNGAVRGQLGRGGISNLTSVMTGAQEVPAAGDPAGAGVAKVMIHRPTNVACIKFTVGGIATATAAHIHTGLRGVAGPVLIALDAPPVGHSMQCLSSTDLPTVYSAPRQHYINIHNADFAGGAIRGQLARQPRR